MNTNIQTLFGHMVERYSDLPAIDARTKIVSYAQLAERSNNLANFLHESGMAPGSLLVILAAERVTVITAILAALKAGCAFVPLDPELPQRRLEMLLAEIAPSWIVSEASSLETLGAITANSPQSFTVICEQDMREQPANLHYAEGYRHYLNTTKLDLPMDPDSMCYIYFTSGSTGKPKGIAGRLKAIDHFVGWEIDTLGVGVGTRVSQLTTPSFDAFLRDVFTPLCAGGTVCIPPAHGALLDARKLVDWIDNQRIEVLHCVPSVFRTIVNEPLQPALFPKLRYIAMAGETLLPSDVKRWMQIFGERVQLVNLYGPSETTMVKFFYFVQPADQNRRSIPIGKPMQGARAMIVDAQGKPCPPGTIGEIYIRTPYCSLGYYGQPELTHSTFFKNPYTDDPNDIIYKTGDFGRVLEDGNFELLGRRDHQVKMRGVRVELDEIENVIRMHAHVRDVVVVDREATPGNKYLCAYVVLAEPTDPQELRTLVAAELPAVMVPSVFMFMTALPRTITGKVDRKALPAPEQAPTQAHDLTPPRTPIEEMLVALWMAVLGVPLVGVHNNFFELGGHSLLATQLLARVYDAFQVEIPLQRLLQQPTVAALAEAVEEALLQSRYQAVPPLRPVARDQALPLSFAQQRLWTIDQVFPGNVANSLAQVIAVRGRLDVGTLARSINAVIARHEALRTIFKMAGDQPIQVIMPTLEMPLPVIDVQALSAAERSVEADRLASAEAQRPFDLARGPLLRTTLLLLEKDSYRLLLTMHHIVSDAWSLGIFMREVLAFYAAYCDHTPIALPELPLQYADFAVWLRQWMQGRLLQWQLAYWQAKLAGAPAFLELPTDRPRPAVQSFQGAYFSFDLAPDLTAELQQLSLREGTTLFMTLLSAFTILLYRYSGQPDIIIGTPMVNRHRTELEHVIGFFADILVLRADLSRNPSVRALLHQVRTTVLEAYDHRHIPFERLVDIAGHKRNPAYNPLVQVLFSYQEGWSAVQEVRDLHFTPVGGESGMARVDLFLTIASADDRLVGKLEYSTDLFDVATIQRMVGHLTMLLRGMLVDPQIGIAQLPLMTAEERAATLPTRPVDAPGLSADLRRRLERLLDGQKGADA